jgi:hypothetical protein
MGVCKKRFVREENDGITLEEDIWGRELKRR